MEPRLEIALALVALLGLAPGYAMGWVARGIRNRRRYRHS